jgi:hypothetical protein
MNFGKKTKWYQYESDFNRLFLLAGDGTKNDSRPRRLREEQMRKQYRVTN